MSDEKFSSVPFTFPIKNESVTERKPLKYKSNSSVKNITVSEYKPTSPLIEEVKISKDNNTLGFCENFYKDALKYYNKNGAECDFVDYSAFFPQYSSMSEAQIDYYLYWRSCLRRGEIIKATESYILLYIYEICNLSEKADPEESYLLLNLIYNSYSSFSENIALTCAGVIRDFSLIHAFPPPKSILPFTPVLNKIAKSEFFFSGENAEPLALLYLTSEYIPAPDKLKANEKEDYIYNFTRAFIYAYEELKQSLPSCPFETVNSTFESYRGVICTSGVKRKITLKYRSPVFSDKMRKAVTDTSKYIDNKLRAYYGMGGRMRCDDLKNNVKEAVDGYFNRYLPKTKKIKHQAETAPTKYDELYEPKYKVFSPKNAEKLEKSGWEATKILIRDTEDENDIRKPLNDETEEIESGKAPEGKDPLMGALVFLLRGDSEGFCKTLLDNGILPEAGVEMINSRAFELFNDSVIEQIDEKYVIIKEYVKEAEMLVRGEE